MDLVTNQPRSGVTSATVGEAHGCCRSWPTLALKGRHIPATVRYIAPSGLRIVLQHSFRGFYPRLIILRAFSAGSIITGLLMIFHFTGTIALNQNYIFLLVDIIGIGSIPC